MNSHKNNLKVILTHVIPTIGRIQVELFEPAASIYTAFQNTEIIRLNNLSQLGQLSRIHSGAHHTRWDYVMLKLYLLKCFKQYCPGAGLSSEVPCLRLNSGCQTIQAYSLLRNFGHLEGCFETERVILEACVENTHIRSMLLSLVPQKFRGWATKLIKNEDAFRFYQLLSVVFTEHSLELQDKPKLKQQCLEILYRFLVKPDNRIQILKDRHSEIRTLAYLALDMHYTNIGLEYNLGSILLSAKDFGQKLFGASMSRFQKLSGHVLRYVSEAVYTSPQSSWAFLQFRKKAYSQYLRKMGKYKTQKPFLEFLRNLKQDTLDWKCEKTPVYTKLYLPSSTTPNDVSKPISESKKLVNNLGVKKNDISIVSLSPGNISHAYVYHPKFLVERARAISERYRHLMEQTTKLYQARQVFNRKQQMPSFVISSDVWSSIDSLFRSCFYLLTDDRYEIILERTGVYNWCSGVCCESRPKAEKTIRKIFKSGYLSHLPKQRRVELECILYTIIESSGGFTSACFSNIKILRKAEFQRTNKEYEVAEIDGAVFSANKWHTKLYLIEGKKQKASSSASARKQLQTLIDKKITIPEPFKSGIEKIVELPKKGAYLPIRLP